MNEFLLNEHGELIGLDGRPIHNIKHPSKGSRAEFEKHYQEVPVDIKRQIKSGKLRLADTIIYSIKPVGGSKTIKMFEPQDVKEIGFRNISNAKLQKNQTLLCSGIYLLQGKAPAAVPGSPTDDEIKAADFTSLVRIPALANGEWGFKVNKVSFVPDNTPTRVFVTDNNLNVPLGFYKLDNARLITEELILELTVELGTTHNIPGDTFLYAGLVGTITTP